MKSFSILVFYLLILLLPTQFGRHFFLDFSFVSGVRIDYLSPTLYLTDILIFFLFVRWFIGVCHRERSVAISLGLLRRSIYSLLAITTHLKHFKFVVLIVFLIGGILLSKNQWAGWYGFFKLLEFVFLGFYTAGNIKKLKFGIVLIMFSVGVIFESFLAILQYLHQGSIGGIFYFFGERTFNGQTPGIANASLNGELVLRPYGTLPHPNVLAGYLIITLAMVIANIKYQTSNIKKIVLGASLTIGTLALFLTMSRVAIVLWMMILVLWFVKFSILNFLASRRSGQFSLKSKNLKLKILVLGFVIAILLLSPLRFRFADIKLTDESILVRETLINSSLIMIKDHPFLGVGLNNFMVELPYYQKINNYFIELQPVHNIFFLIAAETGIIGLAFFMWFIFKTYKRIKERKSIIPACNCLRQKPMAGRHNSLFIILFSVLVLGLFDHYFLTLQQGQLLFSLILGLCWADFTLH